MDTYEVKFLTSEHQMQHDQLMRYAFNPNARDYKNISEDPIISPNKFLGVFNNSILASTLEIIHYKQKIRGTFFPMAGIAGVATSPTSRQQGLTRKLFDTTFKYCTDNNIPISVLYPFKTSFYEQFGYAVADDLIFITDHITSIKTKSTPTRKFIEIIDQKEAIKCLKPIYNKFLSQYNYLVDREASGNAFERRFNDGFFFICQNEFYEDVGYIVVRMEEKDNTLLVREWIALDNITKQAIWNFIALHKDQRKFFRIPNYGPAIQSFYPYLNLQHVEKYDYRPNSMFRVVDIGKLLPYLRYPEEVTEHIEFRVIDNICPWNEGPWSLNIQDRNGVLKSVSSSPSLTLDCKGLAQLIAGFCSSEDLLAMELLSGSPKEIKKLDKIFPKEYHLLRDFF